MSLFVLSIWSLSWAVSAVRTKHDESRNTSISRRLISGSSSSPCASTGGYTGKCIATNPDGCPCDALTTSEKQAILDLHNARRDAVAGGIEKCALDSSTGAGATNCPAATDMNYLFWDPALETMSTWWANQCIYNHHGTWSDELKAGKEYLTWYQGQQAVLDATPEANMYDVLCAGGNCKAHGFTVENRMVAFVGENMAVRTGGGDYTVQSILDGVNAWYDESKDFVWVAGTSGKPRTGATGVVGHWTAGVWAKTRYLGCGYAVCPGTWASDSPGVTQFLNIVCKYYPAGNFNDAEPYTRAASTSDKCSACEADRQGCISSVTPVGQAQNALCGGSQCSACAVDKNQQSCAYGPTSCPSAVFTNDGTVGPAMQPTSRPVAEPVEQKIATPSPSDHPSRSPVDAVVPGEEQKSATPSPSKAPSRDPTGKPVKAPVEAPAQVPEEVDLAVEKCSDGVDCACPAGAHQCTLVAAVKSAAQNAKLSCGSSAECTIDCVADSACAGSTIDCGSATMCVLTCTDKTSCEGITVNAVKANVFECKGHCDAIASGGISLWSGHDSSSSSSSSS